MSEQRKYDKIVMLVHPMYYVLYNILGNYGLDQIKTMFTKKKLPKKVQYLVSILLREYGRAVLEQANNPNTLFVVIEPAFKDRFNMYSEEELALLKSIHEQILLRFYSFAKTKLGDRFQITNFDPDYRDTKFLSRDVLSKLNMSIDITGLGEYGDGCVLSWPKYFESMLFAQGHSVTINAPDEKKTLFGYVDRVERDSLDARFLKGRKNRTARLKIRSELYA